MESFSSVVVKRAFDCNIEFLNEQICYITKVLNLHNSVLVCDNIMGVRLKNAN